MGGTVTRRVAVTAGLVLATALVGCGSAGSDRDDSSPESSGPTPPATSAGPATSPPVDVQWPAGGTWDIRYLEDGEVKVLKVEDFPR